ncbi:MAG: glucuronidase [Herbinix sp.]|nr:glucuronidase [Herbinix sp.]
MSLLKEKDMKWVKEIWRQVEDKQVIVAKRNGVKIPYTTKDGVFIDKFAEDPSWWTNGFWGGMLMMLFKETKDEIYLELANHIEDRMDEVLHMVEDGIHHDVGFMWYLSSGLNYKLTGNKKAKTRTLIAANYLASRFTIKGGYIIAWNGTDRQGWSIIDSMMNIPLLFFASEETGYNRYREIAIAHADKTLENFIRPDGSVNHIVVYDPQTGEKLETLGGQGYEVGSSWSRGQSWAINGFAQAYNHTKDQRYLDAAKKVAHYFIACISETGYIPLLDFRSPKEPVFIDTTAGAIAASGLIDIAKAVPIHEKELYLNAAVKIVIALAKKELDVTLDTDNLLRNGSEAYGGNKHLSIIYGDYYFMEAILKLKNTME